MAVEHETLRIYFCGSIRGGRQDLQLYQDLIDHLKSSGTVLTEHIGKANLEHEFDFPSRHIHDRDLAWLQSAELVVAEVSTPSLGVGYELGRAVEMGKPILCLYRREENRMLSGMISGSPAILTKVYRDMEEARQLISGFLNSRKRESRDRPDLSTGG